MSVAWISHNDLAFMQQEAERTRPLETGGVLMGYWTKNKHEVVIRTVMGPGPKAKHGRTSFAPDHDWQEQEIARIYQGAGRFVTYLGDWHSHPSGSTRLSMKDRLTLWRIAIYKEARIAQPIMGILAGSPWNLKLWHHEYAILFDTILLPFTRELKIRQFLQ